MDQVITFDKSLQQRLEEYQEVLGGYHTLPVSSIQEKWGFYLELTLDPNGWQAVWKIQRKTCEALNIPFPSVVLVLVLSLELKDLTASVRILAVQDDIHLPEKHCVPLTQLWPTKHQDKSVYLNLQATANSLDMLRFFYHYVFMPWDYEDDDSVDWRTKHLEPRLRLYYDMKNGILPRVTAERLHSLFSEAKQLQVKQEELEDELEETGLEDDVNVNHANVQALMKLHIRILEIKGEVDILENPLLRSALIKIHNEMSLVQSDTQQIWVVYSEGTASEIIKFLSKVETLYPSEVLKHSTQLSSTLQSANSNDTFILSESKHCIKTTGGLEHGGTLKGISTLDKTILTTEVENVMLDFKGDVLIENVTINATSPQCAIIVRSGRVTLNNCKLVGDPKSSTHQGIIVLKEASLEIINCDISNFNTAIVGNSGSNIVMENCEIYDCNFGLQIYDNCLLKAVKVTIRNCKNYGICVETENNTGDRPQAGDFDTLNIIPKLQLEFVKGNDNLKGDAVIKHSQLPPIEDLFVDPDSDPTICIESDEEMDTDHAEDDGRTSPATV